MDSPKTTANSIGGRKDSTGPVLLTPIRLSAQPHWKTATSTPNEVAIDKKFITAVVSGITILRNTRAMMRKERATIIPMNSGSLT